MQYTKPALDLPQQADLILARGLVADRQALIDRLQAVGYYRLYAYLHPFKLPDNTFVTGTTLDEVWYRYTFDRQLRLLVNYVRNLCAHHARIWNRELSIRPMIPFEKNDPRWHAAGTLDNRRIFTVLSLLRVLLQRVAPTSSWRERTFDLFGRYPSMPPRPMGFPPDWMNHPLWR